MTRVMLSQLTPAHSYTRYTRYKSRHVIILKMMIVTCQRRPAAEVWAGSGGQTPLLPNWLCITALGPG